MNIKNKFYNEDENFARIFVKAQHSSVLNRTKSAGASEHQNVELIKGDTSPVPMVTVKYQGKTSDPIKNFINRKKDYEFRMTKFTSRLVRFYKIKKISRESNVTKQNIENYILHKHIDPCPYMSYKRDGCYIYPHNGTLKSFDNGEHDYLVYIMPENHKIRLDKVEQTLQSLKVVDEQTVQSPEVPRELIIGEKSDMVVIRNRKSMKIAKIPENLDECQIEPSGTMEHPNDILASSLNGDSLATIDSKFQLKTTNVRHQKYIIDVNITDYFTDDNILPVSLSSPRNYNFPSSFITFSSKQSFGIIDTRNPNRLALDSSFNKNDLLFKCEKIFTHSDSLLNMNHVYIASSHMLNVFDYRNLKQPIVYWTHQLYKPPMMMTSTMYGLTEVVCLSSTSVGDLKILNFNGNSVNNFPYRPSSIANSFNSLKEQGHFLLADNLNERINGSVTGVALIDCPQNSTVKLYTQNCYGDVFGSDLICKEIEKTKTESVTKERFQDFEEFLSAPLDPNEELTTEQKILNGNLVFDNIWKFENLPKYLSDKKSPIEINDLNELEAENQTVTDAAWKIDINWARECSDLMATKILDLWDDVDRESLNGDGSEKEEINKVEMWLESAVADENNSQEMSMDFDPEVMSTQNTVGSSSKRKSRIAGF